MAVDDRSEEVDIASCSLDLAATDPRSLRRNRDGSWSLTIDHDYRFTLPDGRSVRFFGEVRLRGRQSGRKPYPRKGDA